MVTTCNCRGGPNCCMLRQPQGVPRPLPPDQIKPLSPDVGIYEGEGQSRAGQRRGDKCACGTYLDEDGKCVNADMEHRLLPPRPPALLPETAPEGFALPEKRTPDGQPPRRRPAPPPPAPAGFGIPEIRGARLGLRGAFRRFVDAVRLGGVR